MPVLLLHGERDTLIDCEQSRVLASALANGIVEIIPNATHNDGLECVGEIVARALAVFCSSSTIDNDDSDNDEDSSFLDFDDAASSSADATLTQQTPPATALGDLSKFDVVVIGAGPVGLATAVSIAVRCNAAHHALRIIVLERLASYVRTHVLLVDPDSLKDFVEPLRSALLALGRTVRTNDLEQTLRTEAQAAGVTLRFSCPVTHLSSLLNALDAKSRRGEYVTKGVSLTCVSLNKIQ